MNRVRRRARASLQGALLLVIALSACGSPLPPAGMLQVEVAAARRTPQVRSHSGFSDMTLDLAYAGPQKWLAWGVEHWSQGKPAPVQNWKRYEYDHPRKVLSFSIQDENFQGKPPGYGILMELKHKSVGGGATKASGGLTVANPPFAKTWTASLSAGLLEVPKGQESAVWGLFKNSGGVDLREGSSLENLASQVEWAILLKVRMED